MKSGEVTISFSVMVILSAAGIVFLLILFAQLLTPVYSEGKVGAEAYMDNFNKVVNEGGGAVQVVNNGRDLDYYLVYFGGKVSIGAGNFDEIEDGLVFVRSAKSDGDNVICVCYDDDFVSCGECRELDMPIYLVSMEKDGVIVGDSDFWVVGEGSSLELIKEDAYYVLS
jgi:hypothetical protein